MSITIADLTTMAAGATAWAMAIPAVKIAGNGVATGSDTNKGLALLVGIGIAYATTPLLSLVLGWKTASEKVRGVALALGTAQTIDGLVHLFYPSFYHENPTVGLGCAGNIFYGAGLLGIFSAYQ
ncbi:expressed unknown protein [Seminavis robusta]|uniref:Uncharacterized protein n=1 Tax=Seminavis robusta TaxID=568900 RepID=A0A9N8EBI5_9STRA|nr:expressed unknown protein [Seminavis robusta]|eukprot:Sro765_g199240.1 n/a (125) ;mRNA; f:36887-37357